MTEQDWISTGKAAAILGYSRWTFVEKFEGCIPCRRQGGGHRRWLRAAVEQLADSGLKTAV